MSSQANPGSHETTTGETSRKVVAYQLLSLDGVAEDPDRFITAWDDETDANLADVLATQDAVILGRRSYDVWAAFWPNSEIEPFASFITAVPKYVATSTPLDREWANSQKIEGGLVEFVQRLKGQPGGDIGVHASISVTRALLGAGVVDQLRLVVAPMIVGSGQRLLDGLPPLRLETITSTTSPSGHLLVDYRVMPQAAAG
jgi:dihydrofolate reductase